MAEMTKSKELTTYDFREMEARDEAQILAELQGELVEEMIYQFPNREGRTVTGISWMGIKEIARRYGKIDVNLVQIEDLGDAIMIVVKAIDIEKGTGLLGTSTQSKMMKKRDSSEEPDPFYVQKAMSKAQRNAIRSIIPETYFKAVFAELAKDHPSTSTGRKYVDSTQSEPSILITSASGMEAYLRDNDCDPGLVEIVDEIGVLVMTPVQYLETEWTPINRLVQRAGGSWIKVKGAKNYWRIPIADAPEELPQEPQPEEPELEAEPEFNPFASTTRTVESIQEIEYILDGKFPGAHKLFAVTEDARCFTVEPMKMIDDEVTREADALLKRLGGKYRKVSGKIGYMWIIEKKEEE